MLPDVRIKLATVRLPGGRVSDRATALGHYKVTGELAYYIEVLEIIE